MDGIEITQRIPTQNANVENIATGYKLSPSLYSKVVSMKVIIKKYSSNN